MEDKLFELLRIFREKVSKLDKWRYMKSVETGARVRVEGNEAFSRREFEKSIELYTEVSVEHVCDSLTGSFLPGQLHLST